MFVRIGLIALLMAPTCSVASAEKAADKAEKADGQKTLAAVRTHGNTQPAGVLKNGTLTLNLRVGDRGVWRDRRSVDGAVAADSHS
jgi:hypothetical protein